MNLDYGAVSKSVGFHFEVSVAMRKMPLQWLALLLGLVPAVVSANDPPAVVPVLQLTEVPSSLDGKLQKVRSWFPESPGPHPILVSLHSWSGDCMQDHPDWVQEAVTRQWGFLEPDFRGVNDHPEACGSSLARQDVIDALDWAIQRGDVDPERVYLAGISGGGHMTMLMSAYYPERFSAASAWVGISDLREWHSFHTKPSGKDNYAQMTEACCGGPPGSSAAVDLQYLSRSPIHFLQHAAELPLDLNAGITDGKTGSVPIQHTLNAFNVIAKARQTSQISPEEVEQLWTNGHLTSPQHEDRVEDSSYGRQIHLRRTSGPSRVTLFEGGHEGLAHPACEWLAQQKCQTRPRGQ